MAEAFETQPPAIVHIGNLQGAARQEGIIHNPQLGCFFTAALGLLQAAALNAVTQIPPSLPYFNRSFGMSAEDVEKVARQYRLDLGQPNDFGAGLRGVLGMVPGFARRTYRCTRTCDESLGVHITR